MKDIFIRDIDPMYIKSIDKKCKLISDRLGKRVSRESYIRSLIQNDFEKEYLQLKQDQFDQAVGNLAITLERQENKLQEYIDETNELIRVIHQNEEEGM